MTSQSHVPDPAMQSFAGPLPSLRIEKEDASEIIVSIDGLLKFDTIDCVKRDIELLLTHTPTARLTIDCAMVDFVDSQALAMLIALSRRCRQGGGELALRNPRPMVSKLLHMTRMDSLFAILHTDAAESGPLPSDHSPRAPLKSFFVHPSGG